MWIRSVWTNTVDISGPNSTNVKMFCRCLTPPGRWTHKKWIWKHFSHGGAPHRCIMGNVPSLPFAPSIQQVAELEWSAWQGRQRPIESRLARCCRAGSRAFLSSLSTFSPRFPASSCAQTPGSEVTGQVFYLQPRALGGGWRAASC